MVWALLIAVSATGLGCREKEAPTPEKGQQRGGPGPLVTKFRIGRGVDRSRVAVETDSFQQGDAIAISFQVANVPNKSPIRVVWSDSARQKIAEDVKTLPSGGAIVFEMKGAESLAVGDYVVEFFFADPSRPAGTWSFLGTKPFKVGPKRAP